LTAKSNKSAVWAMAKQVNEPAGYSSFVVINLQNQDTKSKV